MQDVFFNIIYMAVLANIELTLCWYRINTCSVSIYPVYVVDIAILTTIKATLRLHRLPSFLFTSSTLIDIESTSCIHRTFFLLHRRYCRCNNVDQHRIDTMSTSCVLFLVYIVDNVDIAMLIDKKSISCLNRAFLSSMM